MNELPPVPFDELMLSEIAVFEPTPEEHRAASAAWLAHVGPCLYANWPEALKELSFRTVEVPVSKDEIDAILDMHEASRPNKPSAMSMAVCTGLAARLDSAIEEMNCGPVFFKLSSRSPKDTFYNGTCGHVVSAACQGRDVLNSFFHSDRIMEDLIEWKYADAQCTILLREWGYIQPESEFRCFIGDGKISGVTQYFYDKEYPGLWGRNARIDGNVDEGIKSSVFEYLDKIVLPVLHAPTLVVDIALGAGKGDPRTMVIEINPWGTSDPCLFTYGELMTADRDYRLKMPNFGS